MLSTSASLSIAELLSGPFLLNVPVYQRPYSWGREQAEQLFDDVCEEAGLNGDSSGDSSSGYFLGTILLMDVPGNHTAKISSKLAAREFDVVDGQQRVVTLLTLFAVLRDAETDPKRPIGRRVDRMMIAQTGSRFFKSQRQRVVLGGADRAIFDALVAQPGSTVQAGVGVEERSELLAVRDLFKRLVEDFTEADRLALAQFIADKCHVVVIVSHDIDRAHRAFVVLNERGKRLASDDILKADVLSQLGGQDVAVASEIWDSTARALGRDFEHFFAHLRAVYGHTRPKIVSGVRQVVREAGGALAFLREVFAPLAQSYLLIRSGGEGVLPAGMARRIAYLNRLPDGDWAPAAMLALKDWRSDVQRADFLLAEIDRLAHLTRMLCAGTGKRVRRFSDLIAAMRSGEVTSTNHAALQITRDETRNIAFHLRDLHKRNPKVCKLVLLRLSDVIGGAYTEVNPDQYTIEHILPQRPSASSLWRQWYATAEERSEVVDSLGNLVLITQAQNDKAKNASWEQKKQIYLEASPRSPLLPITRDVLYATEWRRFEIEAREQRLIELIQAIWRIDLRPSRAASRAAE